MNTPIWDFVKNYALNGPERLHMPGHKGVPGPLGVESYDITEVAGADELYQASGIIRESEKNAALIFGSGGTLYSTEGSSQCIKAMVYLALTRRPRGRSPLIVAPRNVHSAFIQAAGLCGAEVEWLWPGSEDQSEGDVQPDLGQKSPVGLISYHVSARSLLQKLEELKNTPPAAVYLTSPDYMGCLQDIKTLSDICHRYDIPLLVDDAHGAYLKFVGRPNRHGEFSLSDDKQTSWPHTTPSCADHDISVAGRNPAGSLSMHPLDLGADMCCDSAHKTLPVLTGGAYLHISRTASQFFSDRAKAAMALFGSTSPSYLVLCSLDLCNRYLSEGLPEKIKHYSSLCMKLKKSLSEMGFDVAVSDPLRIVIRGDGARISQLLREAGLEPEYAGNDTVVLMISPFNNADFPELVSMALKNAAPTDPISGCILEDDHADLDLTGDMESMFSIHPRRITSIREALFSLSEDVPVHQALGKVSASVSVSCPPGIPIVMPGELIDESVLTLMDHYKVSHIDVVAEKV